MHIRRIHEANVEKRENGDVIIKNIPMVDQGPKGYCVPATFERCMRYMEIPRGYVSSRDGGNTGLGGGTVVSTLVNQYDEGSMGGGRTFQAMKTQPDFRDLQRMLDKGVPMLWGMHSTEWFNETANRRTAMRKSTDTASQKNCRKGGRTSFRNAQFHTAQRICTFALFMDTTRTASGGNCIY